MPCPWYCSKHITHTLGGGIVDVSPGIFLFYLYSICCDHTTNEEALIHECDSLLARPIPTTSVMGTTKLHLICWSVCLERLPKLHRKYAANTNNVFTVARNSDDTCFLVFLHKLVINYDLTFTKDDKTHTVMIMSRVFIESAPRVNHTVVGKLSLQQRFNHC